MKNQKISISAPILCFLSTVVWIVSICVNLHYLPDDPRLAFLIAVEGLGALISLSSTIRYLIRYNRSKGNS